MQLDPTHAHAAVLANDFHQFVRWAWPIVSKDQFEDGHHVRAICHHLDLVARGVVSKLVILCPVRHGKSLIVSVLFPVFRWIKWASCRIITGTYSQTLTVRDAVRSRQLIESDAFKQMFGPYLQLGDDGRKDYYQTADGGHRLSVSTGSRTAGFDADLILADDLHDMATRHSAAERGAAKDYFHTALSSRLVLTGREAVVVAGHRVHEDDLYADLLAQGGWAWCVLDTEHDPEHAAKHPNSHWTDPRRAGELLWPARIDPAQIAQFKRQYRSEYHAVFNQRPTAPEGALFKLDWFREWRPSGDSNKLGDRVYGKSEFTRYITVDLAIGTKASNDSTVAQVWDVGQGQMVLVHQERVRVDGAAVVPLIAGMYRRWRPEFVGVEDVAFQRVVVDQLRAADIPVKSLKPGTQDKQSRSVPAQIRAEAGAVWLPAGADWTADWLAEVCAFPSGKHDDQVDAFSWAAKLAERYAGAESVSLSPLEQADADAAREKEQFQTMLWAGCPY